MPDAVLADEGRHEGGRGKGRRHHHRAQIHGGQIMYTPVWFVRRIPLPATVEGVTIPNDDGTFDIYINESLPPERQEDALRHELRHITKDHLYDDISPVEQLEREADTRDSLLNNHVRTIPLIQISA